MARNRKANLVGTITATSLNVESITLISGHDVSGQANNAYAQANAAYSQGNSAYSQANSAYTQGNSAYSQANSAYTQANTATTNAANAYSQANNAYSQANSAYADSNTRVLKSGDTMTGQLNISSGGLLVTGNSNFDSGTLFVNSVANRVGVGTTNPQNDLDVVSSGSYSVVSARNLGADGRSELRAEANNGQQILLNAIDYSGIAETITNATGGYYIGTETTAPLIFRTNNIEQVRINSSGNVGIKTNNPTSNLHVVGNANITLGIVTGAGINAATVNATTINASTLLTNSGINVSAQAADAYSQANNAYSQANSAYGQANLAYTQANNAYTAANNSNLKSGGVITGTLNVTQDIIIGGNVYLEGNTTFINVATYSIEDSLIYMAANNTLTDSVDIGFVGAKNSSGTFAHTGFARDATDGKWKLFDGLADSGHVGNVIDFANTTLATLVANVEASSILLSGNAVATNVSVSAAYSQANSAYGAANNRVLKAGDTMTGQLNISAGGLLVTGSVGFGTANPQSLLHIINASAQPIRIGYNANLTSYLGTRSDGNFQLYAYDGATATYKNILLGVDASTVAAGDVGIGTTSPGEKLHVQGNITAKADRFNFKAQKVPLEGSPQNGVHKGYILLAKAYTSGAVEASYVIGKIIMRRGTTSTGHNLDVYEVVSTTGYQGETFTVQHTTGGSNGSWFERLVKCTYGGVVYHAIETSNNGGEPSTELFFEGAVVDSPLKLTDGSYVSSISAFGNMVSSVRGSTGYIGINTISPRGKLDVSGNTYIGNTFYVNTTGEYVGIGTTDPRDYPGWLTVDGGINIRRFGTDALWIHSDNNNTFIEDLRSKPVHIMINSVERFTFANTFNFGLNTTSPGASIHIRHPDPRIRLEDQNGGDNIDLFAEYGAGGTKFFIKNSTLSRTDLTIDGSGNFGIATSNPLHKLHVTQALDGNFPTLGTGKGALFIAGDTNLYGMYLGVNTTTGDGFIQTMRNDAATAYKLVLNPVGGNVGIGTTSPTAKLDVAGSATSGYSLLLRSGDVNVGTDSVQIAFGYDNTANYRHSIRTRHNAGATTDNAIDFWLWRTSDAVGTLGSLRVMTIEGTGSVGVGNTSPTTGYNSKFKVGTASVDNYCNMAIEGGTESSTYWAHPIGYAQIYNSYGTIGLNAYLNGEGRSLNSSVLYFAGYNNTANAYLQLFDNKLHIAGGGQVGIGTTSPTGKLHIYDTSNQSGDATLYIQSPSSNDWGIKVAKTGYDFGMVVEVDSSASYGISIYAGSSYVFRATGGGNLLLTGTLTESSSVSLKKNINPITNALDLISKICGVTYDRKDGSAKNRAGLIKEEVEKVMPNIVNGDGIQYTNLIAYLVESIKELKAEIDTLKKQNGTVS